MRIFQIILILMFVTAGCANSKDINVLTEKQVIDIARTAVQTNDMWANRAKIEAKKNADGTWSVMVWRIEGYDKNGNPLFIVGGHRFIKIDQQGKVTDYRRGI
jgi:hypothetical protein